MLTLRCNLFWGGTLQYNSPMSGANHPGSPPTIHQCLEDEACRVLAAVVRLSQSVMVYATLHRRRERKSSQEDTASKAAATAMAR